MPWCPKCKNEYKEGYTVCADCGTPLVGSLEKATVLVYAGTEEELHEISDFMHANGLDETEIKYNEQINTYEIFVPEQKEEEAKKLLRVYLTQIAAPRKLAQMQQETEENEQEKEEIDFYKGPYQETEKKAAEYKSGANTLLAVGIVGILILLLLNMGVIPIPLTGFSKMLITGVMGVLFLIFIIMGISSRKSYQNLKNQAGTEKDLKAEMQSFLKEKIQPEDFDADLSEDSPSPEILYFRRMEKMKELLCEQYPDSDAAFIDYIMEETYTEIFES